MTALRWSTFASHAALPVQRIGTFAELAASLSPLVAAAKASLPAWSPCVWPEGSRRSARAALEVSCFVLDIDGASDADLDALAVRIRDRDLAFLWHTTWSHRPGTGVTRARLVVPLATPIAATSWKKVWTLLRAELGGFGDPSCCDASRLYYLPAAPPGEPPPILETREGQLLAVDPAWLGPGRPAVQARSLRAVQPTSPNAPPNFIALGARAILRRLKSALDPRRAQLAAALEAMLRGLPYAAIGQRDQITWRLALVLARELDEATVDELVELFGPSVARMSIEQGSMTLEEVRDKVRRARESAEDPSLGGDGAGQPLPPDLLGLLAEHGLKGAYPEHELAAAAAALGISRQQLRKRWVYYSQRGGTYWLLSLGDGGVPRISPPYDREAASLTSHTHLAPAALAGELVLWRRDRQGIVQARPILELARDHGIEVCDVVYDFAAQGVAWDERTSRLTVAPCPLDSGLEPRKDDDVDVWLNALGGADAHRLMSWLAQATKVARPIAMLFITGEPDTGKSLIAAGVARIWNSDPVPADDALRDFNDAVLRCPVIHIDEMFPRDNQGRMRSAEIRRLVTERDRSLRRKHLSTARLSGCFRLISTTNDESALEFRENVSMHDIRAIAERILHFEAGEAAVEAARALHADVGGKDAILKRIAEHALWLRDTLHVPDEGRLLVRGHSTELVQRLTTASGIRSAVCHWLVEYLINPFAAENAAQGLVLRRDGRILVATRAMAEHWDVYKTNFRPPPEVGPLGRVLAELSGKTKLVLQGQPFWIIAVEPLAAWAERNSIASKEQLDAAIATDTPPRAMLGVN